jgi:hypothetical protein
MKRHKALRKAAGWWVNRLYDDRCIGMSVQILRQADSIGQCNTLLTLDL